MDPSQARSRPLLSPPEAEPPCPAGSWGLPKYPTQASFAVEKDRARATCGRFAGEGEGRLPSRQFWETGLAPPSPWEEMSGGCVGKLGPQAPQHPCLGPLPPSRSTRPLEGDHSPQLAHGAHDTSRTFRWHRMTSQMELMQPARGGVGGPLSVENIKLCQLSPKPAGFINIHLYF